ncbi:acyltransferase family protein [Chondromyces apiculatus]|uniref:Acyltransferase 3 domain-containing protein n=1 Tax=Chondromyces apiculatus DSM 436 TaxID=1192034 RepID=A0A017T2B7_9BACT|nr:acyltransferase [Chondromyces apiculatus]EYF03383.1 Hypothetical protein CAP_5576 [Chondromyces apiculatus DSM 436]
MNARGFFSLDLLDNRYPALHGLRVLAIISVVQYHITWIFATQQHLQLPRGFVDGSLTIFFGMDLFFLLSGFLIGSILLRSLQDSGTQNIRRFYIRRVFRTFPSYYVVLTTLALALPLTAAQRENLPFEYIYGTNFLELDPRHVVMVWGWSLALEEQFYLTVPVLFFVLHRLRSDRARIGLLSAFGISALIVRLVIYFRYRPWNDFDLYESLYFRTHTRFDTLVAGVLLAFVHARYGDRLSAWLTDPLHRALLALPALTCLWLLLRPELFGAEHVQLMHMFAWGTITSVMYFCGLLLLLHGDGWIHRALSRPVFRRVATLGYGVYLVHIPIIDYVVVPATKALQAQRVSMALLWPASLAVTILISLAIGYVMHVLIEKPSLWIRQRLAA